MDAKDGVGDGEPKRGGSAIAALLFVLIVLLVLLVDVLLVVFFYMKYIQSVPIMTMRFAKQFAESDNIENWTPMRVDYPTTTDRDLWIDDSDLLSSTVKDAPHTLPFEIATNSPMKHTTTQTIQLQPGLHSTPKPTPGPGNPQTVLKQTPIKTLAQFPITFKPAKWLTVSTATSKQPITLSYACKPAFPCLSDQQLSQSVVI